MKKLFSLNNEKITKRFFVFFTLTSFILLNIASINCSSDSKNIYIEDYIVSYSYQNAVNDNYFVLKVNLTNNKNSPKNFTIKIEEDDPFDFNEKKWEIQNLGTGASSSNSFTIHVDKDADSKKYYISFNLDDKDDDWDEEFEIRVSKDSPEFSLGTISSSPAKMAPGQTDVALAITLKNIGDYNAEDVIAKLEMPKGFTPSGSYSNEVHVGDINAGSVKTLTFYFDIDKDLENKNYTTQMSITYKNDGDEETNNIDIPLIIFSIPKFEIIKTEELSKLYPGSNGKIKISLKNTGKDAEDVTLRVYQRSDQPFDFVEKSVYIGSLKSNEIGYGVFEFNIDKSANPMKYLLDFQVRSIDGENVIVDDLTSPVVVLKKEINVLLYLIISIACLIIVIVIASILRKKNVKRKD